MKTIPCESKGARKEKRRFYFVSVSVSILSSMEAGEKEDIFYGRLSRNGSFFFLGKGKSTRKPRHKASGINNEL